MEIEIKNVIAPKLRFSEFDKEWKEVKLKDKAVFLDNQRVPLSSSERLIRNGEYPYYGASGIIDYVDDYIFDGEYVLLGEDGANIISRSSPLAFVIKGKCWVNNHAHVLMAKNSAKFLAESLERINYEKYNTGTAQPKLNSAVCKSILLKYPINFEEENKIASFLSAVDKRIDLLEQKKARLEEYKKGVMQQIFNQEIRFKDENGKKFPEWKKNKLKKVIQRFIVPMRDKPKDLTGSIPWCRIEDFNGMYLNASKSGQGVSEKVVDNMNLKVFPKGTLLVSCSAYLGRCAIVQKELITNQTFIGLYPKSDVINVEFLYYSMIKSERKLNRLSSGTTISYLSREEFENFQLELPCIEEQRKIASFLTSIDKKIDMVNKQIERTNQFKKGLLQKMFI